MKKTKQKLIILMLILSLSILGGGCSNAPTPEPSEPVPPSGTETPEPFAFKKDITLLIPFEPGAVGDTYARAFAQVAEKYIDKKVICENKTGGSGVVAVNYMLSQPKDGHMIVYQSSAVESMIATGNVDGFDEKTIEPLCNLTGDYNTLFVPGDSKFKSFQDVLDYAKAHPKEIKWGGAQSMGGHQLLLLQIMQFADVDISYIVYENGTASILAALGKNIDVGSCTSGSVVPYHESGELRMVALTLNERHPDFPDIPTLYEHPGLELEKFGGALIGCKYLFIDPNVPEEAKIAWDDLIAKVVKDPEWIEFTEVRNQMNDYFIPRDKCWDFFKNKVQKYREIYEKVK